MVDQDSGVNTSGSKSGESGESGGPVDAAGVANGGGASALPPPSPDFFSSPFFAERGISPEVASERGYREWKTTQELIDACSAYPGVSKVQVRNIATQSPCGILIPRSFASGTRDPRFPICLPELKPTGDKNGLGLDGDKFKGVRVGSLHGDRRFYHAHPTVKRSFPPKLPNGKKLPMRSYHAAADMTNHINRNKPEKNSTDHAGVNDEHVHWHYEDWAKYVFLKGKLNGKPLVAKCLDAHPTAPACWGARRVYVGLEGCPKADAMLTAIRATGEPSTVCSFAAVTHWDVQELEAWVTRFLMETVGGFKRRQDGYYSVWIAPSRAQQIVLVPDADGYLNKRVRQQALLFRTRLRLFGLNVVIAAPPIPAHIRKQGKEAVGKWLGTVGAKGVDDHLGPKYGGPGTLADMEVLHRELPDDVFDTWALDYKFRFGLQVNRVRRDRRFLEGLSLHSEDDGTFSGSLRSLATAVGLSKDAAYRAANALHLAGEISVDKPLALAPKSFPMTDKKGKKTGEWFTDWDFFTEDRPTFTVPPQLRCWPDTFIRLGEPLTTTEYQRETVNLQRKQLDVLESIDRRLSQTHPTVVEEAERILSAPPVTNE